MISQSETVARYIFSENHFSRSGGGRVKYVAYLPLNGETSVFRIDTLSPEKIWEIGNQIGSISLRRLRSRGDLLVRDVFEEKLEVIEETSNHLLHANITGWPTEKARIKKLAMNLADKATLLLKP